MGPCCATFCSIPSNARQLWNSVHFSQRFPFSATPSPLAEAFEARRASGLPLIDLSRSNPTQCGLLPGLPDLGEPLAAGARLAYSPQSAGAANTRQAIVRYYAEEFGARLQPQQIVLTASTSEGYSYCLKLLADPGDEILIPEPSYPLLRLLIEAEGLRAVPYPLHQAAGEWILDHDYLRRAVNTRSRAIVCVNPNNPTGHFLSSADARWLSESFPSLAILSDEVFADYTWQQLPGRQRSFTTLEAPNAFCLSGLSKICALPQMKLGWIVMPPGAALQQAMEFVADTYLSVSTPVQQAAVEWLAKRSQLQAPISARCQENLRLLAGHIAPVEAGWAALLRCHKQRDEDAWVLALLELGFWIQPGYFYDLSGGPHLVLSLLTPPQETRDGLSALESLL
jgi:alanine-synthesizing transaminase